MANTLDHNLPEREFNLSTPSVRKNHHFFWRTKLSFERMAQISDWIGSLSKEQEDMLDDLLHDYLSDAQDESD